MSRQMNALAYEVDQTLRSVDKATATRLERLVGLAAMFTVIANRFWLGF